MNAAFTATILRQLELSDAQLLARFASSKDADAFAELVRRHGPLVLGVCRRVTGHPQDAEDAFQATFLVLAKKAGVLRNPELLGNYLYGVAFRVASRAKRSAARRGAREVLVAAMPDPPAPVQSAPSELVQIVDAELAQLPACYREAIVLCDLRGQSREAAAAALGVPEGTVSSRLANGRKKLAARLARRGVTLSAVLPLLVGEAQAVSGELVAKTCELAARWAAGGTVPVALAKLVNGGLSVRTMLILGVAMLAGVAGAVFAAQPREEQPPADPPKSPVVAAAKAEAPVPKDEPKLAAIASAPRMRRAVDLEMSGFSAAKWNETGTHFAVSGTQLIAGGFGKSTRSVIWLVETDTTAGHRFLHPGDGASLVAVAPNGSGVLTDVREYHLISGRHQVKWWDIKHGQEAKSIDLELPETHNYAFAADGKTFRTLAWHRDARGAVEKVEALEVDATTGKEVKSLLKADIGGPELTVTGAPERPSRPTPKAENSRSTISANGKRMAVIDKENMRVTVYDLDRGVKLSSADLAKQSGDIFQIEVPYMAFSADGRRLAVSRGIGYTQVFNADTGEVLPTLEGTKQAQVNLDVNGFTGDGRLFAASVTPYRFTTRPLKGPGAVGREQTSIDADPVVVTVWDTQTGKALKTWRNSGAWVAFNPARPLLATLERNGDAGVRVGFWDFAAEVAKK